MNHISNDKLILAKVSIERENNNETNGGIKSIQEINHIHKLVGQQGFHLRKISQSQDCKVKEEEYFDKNSELNIGT